jgi:hypothetical protein
METRWRIWEKSEEIRCTTRKRETNGEESIIVVWARWGSVVFVGGGGCGVCNPPGVIASFFLNFV